MNTCTTAFLGERDGVRKRKREIVVEKWWEDREGSEEVMTELQTERWRKSRYYITWHASIFFSVGDSWSHFINISLWHAAKARTHIHTYTHTTNQNIKLAHTVLGPYVFI